MPDARAPLRILPTFEPREVQLPAAHVAHLAVRPGVQGGPFHVWARTLLGLDFRVTREGYAREEDACAHARLLNDRLRAYLAAPHENDR